jgi:hypothetical protein
MLARHRTEYDGEFILTKTIFRNGIKEQTREWVANPISNQHISGRAAVLGNDTDKTLFDYRILQNHTGGLMGSKRLQLYGTGDCWREMKMDFYVNTTRTGIEEIKNTDYWKDNVVYSTTGICLDNPGLFYTVPYYPTVDSQALAVYLAAFDGHQEVFLLGYNNDSMRNSGNSEWEVNQVLRTYSNVKFWLVGVKSNMPTIWRNNRNVAHMDYRDFISYCDV